MLKQAQLAYASQTALYSTFRKGKGKDRGKGKGKSKGFGKGKLVQSNLSIADRKAKLQDLKAQSRCLRCGAIGHWAGDKECRFRTNERPTQLQPPSQVLVQLQLLSWLKQPTTKTSSPST